MDSPLVKYVVPVVGNVLGATMLLSPCKAVWEIRKTQNLGAINPLPYPLTCVNCMGWLIYGAVINDPLIPPANVIGVVAGVVFTMAVLPTCARKMQDILLAILATATLYFAVLSMVSVFALDNDVQRSLWGISAIVWLMVYYLIPLSTMVQIVKTKDASSIYLPLACAAALNGGLWTIYGLAIHDIHVWGPNAFGVGMAVVQFVLKLIYGRAKPKEMRKDGELPTLNGGPGSDHGSNDEELIMANRDSSRNGLLRPPSNPLAVGALSAVLEQDSNKSMSDSGTWSNGRLHGPATSGQDRQEV